MVIKPYSTNLGQLARWPSASHQLLPWLALIYLFWSYLSHFKSHFYEVKSKVGLLNWYNLSSYLASHHLVFKNAMAIYNVLAPIYTRLHLTMFYNNKVYQTLLNLAFNVANLNCSPITAWAELGPAKPQLVFIFFGCM